MPDDFQEPSLDPNKNLSDREKAAVVEETLLAKSLMKRREWAEKYNVS